MKISIIIPTKNSEKYISETLKSIKIQQYQNYEVILVDYNSTDQTIKVFNEFKFKKNSIIKTNKPGVPNALNLGFQRACGDIVCWINSDDVYENDLVFQKISKQNFNKYEMIYGNSRVIDEYGKVLFSLYSWKFTPLEYPFGTNLFTGSVFFSKKLIDNFGGFSGNLKTIFEYEIIDYCIARNKCYFVNLFIARLRHHPNSITSTQKELIDVETNRHYRNKKRMNKASRIILRIFGHLKSGNFKEAVFGKINKK